MLMSSKWNLDCGALAVPAGDCWLAPWGCPSSVAMGVLVVVDGVDATVMPTTDDVCIHEVLIIMIGWVCYFIALRTYYK